MPTALAKEGETCGRLREQRYSGGARQLIRDRQKETKEEEGRKVQGTGTPLQTHTEAQLKFIHSALVVDAANLFPM